MKNNGFVSGYFDLFQVKEVEVSVKFTYRCTALYLVNKSMLDIKKSNRYFTNFNIDKKLLVNNIFSTKSKSD